jgi:hypothetical protein
LLFIVDDNGGVGGVGINIICWGAGVGEGGGDGGCGSTNVHNAWLTRRDEHEYEWSSSIDDERGGGGCLPPVFDDNNG